MRAEGTLLRIELRRLGQEPRALLREERLTRADQAAHVVERLRRLDERASAPWTRLILELIEQHPGLAARELAKFAATDVVRLKARVRTLKEHGLTESLATGYRLCPRGRDLLKFIRR